MVVLPVVRWGGPAEETVGPGRGVAVAALSDGVLAGGDERGQCRGADADGVVGQAQAGRALAVCAPPVSLALLAEAGSVNGLDRQAARRQPGHAAPAPAR